MPEENMPSDGQAVDTAEENLEDKGTPENQAAVEEEPVDSEVPPEEKAAGDSAEPSDVDVVAGRESQNESAGDAAESQVLDELEKMEDAEVDSVRDAIPGVELPDRSFGDEVDGFAPETAEARPADFQQLGSEGERSGSQNLDLLMDVGLPISIELGRTSMSIQEILNLGPGSVVELNKLAGEPVDLLVNDKIVARGEVVVIDENFGIRVTSLISPEERLKSLGE
ncbi:MAG: flagellar motor switch protein FliN [candidate division Zixibacteria bacterium]|nr:flagellar motor switch protein FliN [candidate division Zixibacteria bacterium]